VYSDGALATSLPVATKIEATKPPTPTPDAPKAEATKAAVTEPKKPELATNTNTASPSITPTSTIAEDAVDWQWPTSGKVITQFNESASIKGVDISGSQGQAINAAAKGKVIYSGSELRGYGKLLIISHNKTYISVYAHNSKILVKEGQQVSKGQKIAEMGNTDADKVKLHFEVRRQGKSVDPLQFVKP
jgi:lipoprotein NlpD